MRIDHTLRLALAAAGAFLVAGCSNTSTGTGTMITSTPSTSASSNGLESLSGPEIVGKAKQALIAAESVRVKGSVVEQKETLSLDIRASKAGDSVGTLKTPQGSLQVVVDDGTPYVKPDDVFWKNYGGSNPAVLQLLSGKWIKPKAGDASWKSFLDLFNYSELATQVLTPEGTVTKDGTKTIEGTPAIGVIDNSAEPGTLWVATTGPAYPLLIEAKDPKGGSLAFSEFGQPVTATPPPANQIVDLGKIGG